jgi:transposase InsO family protein
MPSSLTDVSSTLTYSACEHGKQTHRLSVKHGAPEGLSNMDAVYSDTVESPVHRSGGAKHAGTFTDAKTRYTAIRGLTRMGDVAAATRQALAQWAVQQGNTTKVYQTDRAKEYKSGTLAEWYANQGITHQETVPYTPQQNGIAERYNRVLVDRVRTCLFESKLGPEFRMECLTDKTTKLIILCIPPLAVPAAEWFGITPDVSSFQPSGQHGYVTHALKYGPGAKLKPVLPP